MSKQTHLLRSTALAFIANFGCMRSAGAATLFSTDFSGTSLDTGLQQTFTTTGTYSLGGTAVFNGGRNYVGTVDADYAVAGFSWTATIDVQHTNFSSNQVFFGLGTGTTGTNMGANPYGEPQGATAGQAANYFSMQNVSSGRSMITLSKAASQAYFAGQQDFSDAQFNTLLGTTGGVQNGGYYRYFLDYNHATNELTFSMSTLSEFGGTAGSKTAFRTVSLAGDGYDSTNGRIFFGGDGNSTFDNFSIVPEPASSMLGLVGVGLICLRRRRL
jgi:MYXO-CTERM domain-containing protein